jgi:hypothetical protein
VAAIFRQKSNQTDHTNIKKHVRDICMATTVDWRGLADFALMDADRACKIIISFNSFIAINSLLM